MENILIGYGAFILGCVLYILGKMQDYRSTAKANPRTDIIFDTKRFFSDEAINIVRLLIAGIALVVFAPYLAGDRVVDIKNAEGAVTGSFSIKVALMPFYFLLGYGGNSAVFNLFGKYKKTFLNQAGISDPDSVG